MGRDEFGAAGATTDAAAPRVAALAIGPGAVIADRYRLDARLGAGGGGTVWRCLDQQLDAVVALKIVSAGGDLERWRREVAMARRIADRNVCRVHDLGEAAEVRFVTMELIEGASLRSSVRPELPAAQARALLSQVVAGAAAIHAAGIVHRDLKPENVVVAHDGRAVIVDFGLARPGDTAAARGAAPGGAATVIVRGSAPAPDRSPVATVTNAGAIVGTPRYMSPEQAAGEPVDARTDVWALGLIGHELLTGHLPDADERGRRVDPAVDSKLPGAAAILRRCLAYAADARFADARALAAALSALDAPPPARNRRAGRTAALGLVAAGVAGGLAAVLSSDGAPAPTPARSEPAPVPAPVPAPAPITAASPVQLRTIVDAAKWPEESPMSIAVHPDGQRFAYTRVGGFRMELVTGRVDGKAALEEWRVPKLWRPGDRYERSLVTIQAAGWFSDGSVALVGSTASDGHALFRVYPDGMYKLLHHQNPRFAVSVSRDDLVAIAVNDDAIFTLAPAPSGGDGSGAGSGAGSAGSDPAPAQLVALGRGEQVLALAWSPDGSQLAVARLPPSASEPAKLQIISRTGDSIRDVWSGPTAGIYDTLLVWLDERRLAFTQQDPVTREIALHTLEVDAPARVARRASWTDEYIGIGSAAGGTVLLLRGTAYHTVQVGDEKAHHLAPVQPGLRGSYLAGWTTDGRVVFAAGVPGKLRVARARPGRELEYWPGTREGVERPHSVVGDSVLVSVDLTRPRSSATAPPDRAGIRIERIGPRGERTELARLANDGSVTPVRCAGDRAGPCVAAELAGNQVVFRALDPERGGLGEILHQRPIGERYECDLAVSADGRHLAIVEGRSELTLFDRETGASRSWPATADSALQSVGFSPTGDLWATSIGFEGRLFGLMVFPRDEKGGVKKLPRARMRSADGQRWYGRPSPSPDGAQVAVTTRELRLHIAQVTGL